MKTLLSAETIAQRVRELGKDISESYGDTPFIMLVILKGSFIFAADIARAITAPNFTMDFVRLSSYAGTSSTGKVAIHNDDVERLKGSKILIVEDIVDTGNTLVWFKEYLNQNGVTDVKICSLLEKSSVHQNRITIDFCGFDIPDKFVVGYGLDVDGKLRQLPYIAEYKGES
ncbi:hypoxanthine phosphoribosyltransferase [bacterium]|nr:hypoxanthine phosphoribosyltransferase [bacterium]